MTSKTKNGPWGAWKRQSRSARTVVLLFVALILVAGPAIGDFRVADSSTKFDLHLQQRLATAHGDERLVVFVLAKNISTAKQAVRRAGMTIGDTFDKVGTAVAQGTPDQIRKVAGLQGVDHVELNRPVRLMLDTAVRATRSEDAYKGFTESGGVSSGVDGTGISIAILDTGIDGTHPFFQQGGKSKVVKNLKLVCPFFQRCIGSEGDQFDEVFIDFTQIGNDTDTGSAGGHGTHVAGIAAGGPVVVNGETIHGAAPGAKLVGLSIGQGLNVYGGSAGLNWVLEHHARPCGPGVSPTDCPPIKVVNNSYGGSGEWNPEGVTARLQNGLSAAGVSVVWAAGNGDELNDGGDGSDNRVNPDAQHPAPGIISVANYDDQGTGTRDGALDGSSSRGEYGRAETYPDVAAPGTMVLSSCRTHLASCKTGDFAPGDYAASSGTSMASPLVAGIVAQLRQAGPWLTPGDIENVIQDTAYKFTAGGPYETDPQNPDGTTSFDKGAGLIDARAAVAKIRGLTVPTSTPPAGFPCTSTGPLLVDPEGDSNTGVSPPEPALDILDASMRWDGEAREMTFKIGVKDLGEDNPASAPEMVLDFRFAQNKRNLRVIAYRNAVGIERFALGSGAFTLDVDGKFDAAKDTVSVTVPNEMLEDLAAKPFEAGDRISGIEVLSGRPIGSLASAVLAIADRSAASCDFVVGTGSARIPPPTPPALPPLPPADSELTAASRRFEWQGSRSTNLEKEPVLGAEVFGCEGIEGPGCEEKYVLLGGSTVTGKVTVTVEGENPNVNDFDLFVYGPDRKLVGQSGEIDTDPGVEELTFEVKKPGIYTLSVHAFLTVDAAYKGLAVLDPPAVQVTTGGQSSSSPQASPSPSPAKKRALKASPPADEPTGEDAEVSSEPEAVPPSFTQAAAPPLTAASPEDRTQGVSTTTSVMAGLATLLLGLGAGFTLARRR